MWIIEFGAASSGRDLEIGRVAREEEPPHISTVAFADRGFVKVPAEGLCRDPPQFDARQRRTDAAPAARATFSIAMRCSAVADKAVMVNQTLSTFAVAVSNTRRNFDKDALIQQHAGSSSISLSYTRLELNATNRS